MSDSAASTSDASDDEILEQIERELVPAVPHDTPQKPLYHYTDAHGFRGIVSTGAIWATHYGFLNDTAELRKGEELVLKVARDLLSKASDRQAHLLQHFVCDYEHESISKVVPVCVASFSESDDKLSQWRAYAAAGGGYSVGFSSFPLPDKSHPEAPVALWLVKCLYSASLIEADAREMLSGVAKAYDKWDQTPGASVGLRSKIGGKILAIAKRRAATISPRFKHPAFEEEQEWRLIALPQPKVLESRASPRGLIPFVSLDLRVPPDNKLALGRVVVGPTQNPIHGLDAAKLFLTNERYGSTVVEASLIPFRG